jgi:hypothetical protein
MKKKKLPRLRNFVVKAILELGKRGSSLHKAKNKYNRKRKHKKIDIL